MGGQVGQKGVCRGLISCWAFCTACFLKYPSHEAMVFSKVQNDTGVCWSAG